MKTNKYILGFLVLFFLTPNLKAQDTLFKKYLSIAPNGVTYLGDQNGDGYDDFMLYDCSLGKAYIFFGGNPMDTIPKFVLNNIYSPDIKVLDVNNDGKLDIIISCCADPLCNNKNIRVYYGGSLFDTIPNLVFSGPAGTIGWGASLFILKDFDGDGHSELIVYALNPPNSNQQNGCLYFYKTYPQLDTIPFAKIQGDSAAQIRLQPYSGGFSSGDINGDGMTDFCLLGYQNTGAVHFDYFRSFYLGNKNFDLTPAVTYYTSQHSFNPQYMQIIKDVNGDHKDDILMFSYGNFYPYYYGNSILYGSFPIDTIPRVGLNTQNSIIRLDVPVISLDYNKDGYNDFMGQCGAGWLEARVWYGRYNMNIGGYEVPKKRWGGGYDDFGTLIGRVGDVNGDGIEDFCIGTSPGGSCVNGNVLIFKGDTLYRDSTTGVKDEFTEPNDFHLSSAYPNPFNNQVRINYYIGKESDVTIHITNTIGEEIQHITKGTLHPGNYYEQIDMTGKASGVYFISLRAVKGNTIIYSKTEKISLIK
jgi:hypothetical protein